MLNLQKILESDSISTLIDKLNNNFQTVSLSGGGPKGIPGGQGIPGLPGKQGVRGSTGAKGDTGAAIGIIPFATTGGGETGPTGDGGPWNVNSYEYLVNTVTGTEEELAGQIWIDHWNLGYWKYLVDPDEITAYTDSPYSVIGISMVPPDDDYYGGSGWYFYPLNTDLLNQSGGDVWINDITTYQLDDVFERGPYSSNSPLTVKNARLLSKYGTVWISSGSGGDSEDNTLETPTLHDWGIAPPTSPNPGRFNAGVDRLYFKQSIDTIPYLSNLTARSYIIPSDEAGSPGLESQEYPTVSGDLLQGPRFWVKPSYEITLDKYSPISFFTERRLTDDYDSNTIFGTLGLYQYSSRLATYDTNHRKSLFLYSTRSSKNPDEFLTPTDITLDDTFNLGEVIFDVKKLIATNQFVCSLPQDLFASSDYINGAIYDEGNASNLVKYAVSQGFISTVNSKSLVDGDSGLIDLLYYGGDSLGGDANVGNHTRSIWYGSAAMASPSNWDEQLDSADPLNSDNPNIADKYYRIAGMRERGKRTWDTSSDQTYFLSELIWYSSYFQKTNSSHEILADETEGIDLTINEQNSRPGLYLSPFSNFGINTFTLDDGVFEPRAKLHIHTFLEDGLPDPGAIAPSVITDPNFVYDNYPTRIFRGGAFTTHSEVSNYLDLYLGYISLPANEKSNPFADGDTITTQPEIIVLDTAIRREQQLSENSDIYPALRFGVYPLKSSDSTDIGLNAVDASTEFPFGLFPLNPDSISDLGENTTPVGLGFHNLYPRSRAHFYGNNKLNERIKTQPNTPGSALYDELNTIGESFPYYTDAITLPSASQIIIDYLGDSYIYPSSIFEYPYEVFSSMYSSNAANFPNRDLLSPTRNDKPWSLTDKNFGYPSVTGSENDSYKHGGLTNLYKVNNYIGFNLFRDLLNTGDDSDLTRWHLGTDGNNNGGSAILGSSSGDIAFANIHSGRDGGNSYKQWEQQGLSTRDIVNNISLIIDKNGDIGIGNSPGYDLDAYSSQERNITDGTLNYVPILSDGDARLIGPYTRDDLNIANLDDYLLYGFINYSSISGGYIENSSISNAALINARATDPEHIKLEIAAEKLYGKNGRSSYKSGWGYPANVTLTLNGFNPGGDSFLRNYLILDWVSYENAGGILDEISLTTDDEGRIVDIVVTRSSGTIIDFVPYVTDVILPHPTDLLLSGDGLDWTGVPNDYEPPVGALAASLGNPSDWTYAMNVGLGTLTIEGISFEYKKIGAANVRLNNFVAGEGIDVQTDEFQNIVRKIRQTSPKLIFSFLEEDNTSIPGSKAVNTSNESGADRLISGTEPYRKVNTVIASAQTESSLREYWIPKSDNTGGTFMVFTDHYGEKEKVSGFDDKTAVTSRFTVEEVVTVEFIPLYTDEPKEIKNIDDLTENVLLSQQPVNPGYVKYFNKKGGDYLTGITGTTDEMFDANTFAKTAYIFGPGENSVYGPNANYKNSANTEASWGVGPTQPTASILRNVDKYYSVWDDSTNWDNGWHSNDEIFNSASQFRFKRINSDFALVDFNMTIKVDNTDFFDGGNFENDRPIDFGSPRWTQYIRLNYTPSTNGDRDWFMRLFGNSLSFMSWSSYNQWYPGTAITSDRAIKSGDALTNTGGPNFNLPHVNSGFTGGQPQNLLWTGNFIDMVSTLDTVDPSVPFINHIHFSSSSDSEEKLFPSGATYLNTNISKSMVIQNNFKSEAFASFMSKSYSLFGNDYLSRNRNCSWRVVPRVSTYEGVGIDEMSHGELNKSNSFTLEMMFDKPILHVDTPFPVYNFSTINTSGNIESLYRFFVLDTNNFSNGDVTVRVVDYLGDPATVDTTVQITINYGYVDSGIGPGVITSSIGLEILSGESEVSEIILTDVDHSMNDIDPLENNSLFAPVNSPSGQVYLVDLDGIDLFEEKTDYVTPYKYLTISGQSIVRYSDATNVPVCNEEIKPIITFTSNRVWDEFEIIGSCYDKLYVFDSSEILDFTLIELELDFASDQDVTWEVYKHSNYLGIHTIESFDKTTMVLSGQTTKFPGNNRPSIDQLETVGYWEYEIRAKNKCGDITRYRFSVV